jgi:S1-C subfamily serine protease
MILAQSQTASGYLATAHRAARYLVVAILLFFSPLVRAGDNLPTTRPLLDELNRETQALFSQTSPSVVRVQLPIPMAAMADDPLSKWATRLDPQVRQRLEDLQTRGSPGILVREDIVPTTLPSGSASDVPPGVIDMQLRSFDPNSVGVVLDDDRHVVVPHYIDPENFTTPATVILPDGSLTVATFVGSDRPTQLTVLKLQDGDVKPAVFGSGDMTPGTLLMVLSLNPAFNRLAVWQGWAPESAVLVTLDGAIVGFSGSGGFVPAQRCQPVVQELIQHGVVHRPLLGVAVSEVGPDDPQRRLDPVLGRAQALRVLGVIPASAADKAGIQQGDLILQFAGQPVGEVPDIAAAVINRQGPTPVLILRNGQRMTVTADLQLQ